MSSRRLDDALRACARGIHPLQVGAGLLIDCGSWLHCEDLTSQFITVDTSISDGVTLLASTDWEAAITALNVGELPSRSGERRMLLLAASIVGGIPVSLYDTLPGLDRRNASLVAGAIAHAAGLLLRLTSARRPQPREKTVTINIEPSAFGPVKAVTAELVVAHWLSERGGNPTLHGGRRRGHDIVDGDQLVDAKLLVPTSGSEKNRYPGCTHKLRRDRWRPFDPASTTHVMLVEFPMDWTARSSTSFTETTITIRHENVHLYLIEVPEFNEILAEGRAEAENENWAFIILGDDWLKEHQVH